MRNDPFDLKSRPPVIGRIVTATIAVDPLRAVDPAEEDVCSRPASSLTFDRIADAILFKASVLILSLPGPPRTGLSSALSSSAAQMRAA